MVSHLKKNFVTAVWMDNLLDSVGARGGAADATAKAVHQVKGLRPPSFITLTITYDGLIEIGDTVLWEFDQKENRTAEGLVIPEPSTLLLVALGLGGVGLAAARARRR